MNKLVTQLGYMVDADDKNTPNKVTIGFNCCKLINDCSFGELYLLR